MAHFICLKLSATMSTSTCCMFDSRNAWTWSKHLHFGLKMSRRCSTDHSSKSFIIRLNLFVAQAPSLRRGCHGMNTWQFWPITLSFGVLFFVPSFLKFQIRSHYEVSKSGDRAVWSILLRILEMERPNKYRNHHVVVVFITSHTSFPSGPNVQ